jgi:hypothetical protein
MILDLNANLNQFLLILIIKMAEMNNEDYIWSIKNGDFESISKHIESVIMFVFEI